MAEITAALVKQLRDKTGAGMMDAKKALTEVAGDMEAAVDSLRTKGLAKAAKKADRVAAEGLVGVAVSNGKGVAVEINSETDFVAKNEMFKAFADQVAKTVGENPNADLEALRTDAVSRIRENIRIARTRRFDVEGNGLVAAYIHTGAKVGVLVEVPVMLSLVAFANRTRVRFAAL